MILYEVGSSDSWTEARCAVVGEPVVTGMPGLEQASSRTSAGSRCALRVVAHASWSLANFSLKCGAPPG